MSEKLCMESIPIGAGQLPSSRLIYGCMRIAGDNGGSDRARGHAAIRAAIEAGFNHFDHADIYGGGACESVFGELLAESPGLRERIILTGKCGIRLAGEPDSDAPKRYDFSREHILRSVEGSLERLRTDHLDLLLLHRPDYLFQADEVAAAFDDLYAAGKVLEFGVSNFTPAQLALLQSRCERPLIANQVEINIHNVSALEDGTLDQCQRLGIRPMAWCPLGGVAYPAWGSTFSKEDEERIAWELAGQAARYAAEPWQLMLAWLLKHPAGILPIIGSTTPSRIAAAVDALAIPYTREDWYRLLEARMGREVP